MNQLHAQPDLGRRLNESYQRNLVFKDQNKGDEGVDQKRVFDVSEERMKIIHEVDREILNGEKSFPPSVVSLRTEELGALGNPLCNEPPIQPHTEFIFTKRKEFIKSNLFVFALQALALPSRPSKGFSAGWMVQLIASCGRSLT